VPQEVRGVLQVLIFSGLCLEDDVLQRKALAVVVQAQSGAKREIDDHSFFKGMRHFANDCAAGSADAENKLRKFLLAMTSHKSSGIEGAPEGGLEGVRRLGRETVPDMNCSCSSEEVLADSCSLWCDLF